MFQKGQGKVPGSGRKPGSKNKKRLAKVADVLAEHDLHPIEEVVRLLATGEMKDSDRAKLWLELQSYCQAKPKDNEDDAGDDDLEGTEDISTGTLLNLLKSPKGAS